ncbi:MAG TPA: UPF0149 family protein [Ottowia sp.]|uniref:UPF0149 family protein n=1 Tax=Ottowia sp. TaxID=1898956 RepID=UPI002D08051E|nr:UPF0149 family protein [Ottowia sp.]HMN20329.1 UPF0149 family protein [Ottowia sp.]
MDEFDHPGAVGATGRLLDEMMSRLMRGDDLQAFGDWFVADSGALDSDAPDGARAARAMARAMWAAVPMPSNHWRPRGLPKIERNDPCHCGSGRKYKHCCAALAHVTVPFDRETLAALAIQHAPPEALTVASLRQVPAHALAQAARFWLEGGQPGQVARVLGPLFEQPQRLDGRYEPAFDALMDALLELGQQTHRFELARQIGQHRDKALATAARARQVTMLADQGEYAQAWALFKQAQRDAPDDPQLLHLELVTLLAEGRADEARLRGPMLAAKARRLGHDELAPVLEQLAEQGLHGIHALPGEGVDAEEAALMHDWLALCAQVPAELDAEAARARYRIEAGAPVPAVRGRKADVLASLVRGMRWLRVRPERALAALERRWQRRFPVSKPDLTWAIGNADSVLDEPAAVAQFLRDHPDGWLSVQVVDDLLLAAQEMLHPGAPPAEQQAAWRLAEHALRLLRALLGEASDAAGARARHLGVEWAHEPSRPLLRLLAQAIDIGRQQQRDVLALLEWSLALNPIDNHGWRAQLADAWIARGQAADALALLERYPDDLPPAEHRRALALYMLDRRDEAQAVLAAAHAEYPAYLDALWPEMLDAPEPEDGPGLRLGSAEAAFNHRAETRAHWVRSGALAWARGLDLPAAPPAGAGQPQAGAPSAATLPSPITARTNLADLRLPAKARQHLRRHYDWPRLHGFITAIAWSPEMVAPGRWMTPVMGWRATALPKTEAAQLKALNADMQAIMQLYNTLTAALIVGPQGAPMPLALATELAPDGQADAGEAELLRWAAGFVQGAELGAAGWRSAGRPVQSKPGKGGAPSAFAALYTLAARAPREPGAAAGAWQAVHDDGQPLLVGLDAPGAWPVAEQLKLVLTDLWQVVLPLRLARIASAAPGGIQLSSYTLDPDD